MKPRILVLRITNEWIYFNPELTISIEYTNLPYKHLTFRSSQTIYWEVEMLHFDLVSKLLSVVVVNYYATDVDLFKNQEAKKAVERLEFGKLDWKQLEPQLVSFQKNQLRGTVFNLENTIHQKTELVVDLTKNPDSWQPFQTRTQIEHSGEEVYRDNIQLDFSEIKFVLGGVRFEYYFKKLDDYFPVTISNPDILPEFDTIKPLFARKLKSGKISASVTVGFINGRLNSIRAESKQIQRITTEFIESIRFQKISGLPGLKSSFNSGLMTSKGLSDLLSYEYGDLDYFNLTDTDLIESLIEKSNFRNKKQLGYLAGKIHSPLHKLQFTLNPQFGFLFIHEGEKMNHFIWELLDSHATYIWSFQRDDFKISEQIRRVENILNLIRNVGRPHYRRAYGQGLQDSDIIFFMLDHAFANSPVKDHYSRWQVRLNEQLV